MSASKDKINTLLGVATKSLNEKPTKEVKPKKKYNKVEPFFNGVVSKHFKGINVYIGDLDFKFADDTTVIIAEIKYVDSTHTFRGKKLTMLQCREYSAMQGVQDNLGRTQHAYVFEAHETNKPYVAAVPFLKPTGKEKHPLDFLDYDNARLVYVEHEDQLGRFIAGDRHVGTEMRQPLKCV